MADGRQASRRDAGRRRGLATALVGGYLLGTIPSARLAARLATGGAVDLREQGTGNPGGVNAMRHLGRRIGAVVVIADVVKGVAAGTLGRRAAGDLGSHVGAVASVGGHCFPLWSGFRGGKGVATSFGQCLVTFPAYAPLDVAVAGVALRLGGTRPALASGAVASLAWVLAGLAWWRRGLPNLWGPRPSAALPLANAATAAVLASRALPAYRRGEPDELAPAP